MRVYWRDVRRGQNLVLSDEEGHEEVIGGFRETKRGIDAIAHTDTYDPGRSKKGFATIADAKAFVESFRPWELHGVQNVAVDPEARPALASESAGNPGPSDEPRESMASESIGKPDPSNQPTESAVPEHQPRKRWWEFWRRG